MQHSSVIRVTVRSVRRVVKRRGVGDVPRVVEVWLRLEWSGRAERVSAPHRAALVARCNDDGDEERADGDGDGRSRSRSDDGDEADGENDDDDDGADGGPAGLARDGIRRVRASAEGENLPVPLLHSTAPRGCSAPSLL